jgi:hypothetical protein
VIQIIQILFSVIRNEHAFKEIGFLLIKEKRKKEIRNKQVDSKLSILAQPMLVSYRELYAPFIKSQETLSM